MFAVKLLANLAVASNFCFVLNMFEHVFTFHISLEVLYYNWPLLKAVNILHDYFQFKQTNQGYSPWSIRQSINAEWRSRDRNDKQFF